MLAARPLAGFGGAFTDAASYVWLTLNENMRNKVLEAYFGPTGNHYTLCRIHIASCDFSLESYTFAPTPNDWTLQNFSLNPDRVHLMPFLKAAHNWTVNPIKMFASPWSPPPWMKVPVDGKQQFDGSAKPFGLLSSPQVHQTYANYIAKYLTEYKKEGINFWGITIQNEPEFAPVRQPSMKNLSRILLLSIRKWRWQHTRAPPPLNTTGSDSNLFASFP